MSDAKDTPTDFIRQMIAADVAAGKHDGRVQTRFPPEPNGYLQIGHAKAICLNFSIAEEFGGKCNLRFDDTNPEKESDEFVRAIEEDIEWLGFKWAKICFASDYFEQLFEWAIKLIEDGHAYVEELSFDEMRDYRGSINEPGRPSPYRERPIEESVDLFKRMRAGEFADGEKVLRAKIDMTHPNMNMRDPVMYRIKRMHHHRLGDEWCMYPSYDFTHGQSDSLEEVTHSLCSLEFEDHRPLYDWFIEKLGIFPSKQTEFSRLNMTYTVVSKRKLRELVEGDFVDGWDDPRMPTLSGMRRRGYPAAAIRKFCETVGITKVNSTSDVALLEHAVRAELNSTSIRRMAVFDPLEIEITNWPEGQVVEVDGVNNPEDESAGTRKIPFSGRLFIEQEDFKEEANRKFFRLKKGGEVRLRYGYIIKCDDVEKDADGNITKLLCSVDLDTLNKQPTDRKVKGVIHWVSAEHAVETPVRLFDRLFTEENPEADKEISFTKYVNPESSKEVKVLCEPSLMEMAAGEQCQFERIGYFCVDNKLSKPGAPVFNRTVALRDSWAKKK
ncbi:MULTISPECIES: glutamine--tRNA ligase/YqeY domain fusion protein [unclassified Lentimonas]|uniref:glutamine--tRNA ligase/YqeY domain fusion protein n=1 Tax=unclassified Lentimonas TaxID=2630993 RepID=UPI0013269572|nr:MULTISPECIES: glutamine--tRNA ligase/YqeY domain fusion protein [unclassified Lentimonas]CAA6679731.1 Glutaminyl-tRNA synthetase (EC [Lentimonas sp. CC4]CAA6683503.1 Glutaminyl-tRNA synthetase (EC [Lentimonas sp. CC6]CAA7077264.1 Glutaminyl-tRNA synthetase (EC [Lentimonas sp. CC4]CAA7171406.1 Glutaminyl-tRNA synthetase (EC [Lentimonas sp. CC21]CAA7182392.1 Glutaminyl-tRNA synthetase (EC [Lentimonas sp. CC8]